MMIGHAWLPVCSSGSVGWEWIFLFLWNHIWWINGISKQWVRWWRWISRGLPRPNTGRFPAASQTKSQPPNAEDLHARLANNSDRASQYGSGIVLADGLLQYDQIVTHMLLTLYPEGYMLAWQGSLCPALSQINPITLTYNPPDTNRSNY